MGGAYGALRGRAAIQPLPERLLRSQCLSCRSQLLDPAFVFQISDKVYQMKNKPRGFCLIFNNYDFSKARKDIPHLSKMKDRKGTDHDKGMVGSKGDA